MATVPEALAIGLEHLRQGQLAQAETVYRNILDVAPQCAEAWHRWGLIDLQRGDLAAASTHLGQALTVRPQYIEAHYHLGLVQLAQQQPVPAWHSFRRAAELKPDFFDAHYQAGSVARDLGDLATAAKSFEQAALLQPNHAETWFQRANIALGRQQADLAIAAYVRLIQLQPNHAEGLNNLGNARLVKDQRSEALQCFEQAIIARPDFPEALNNLGNLKVEQGRTAGAVAHFRRAIELRPDYAEAFNNLATALRDLSQFDESLAAYRRALELKPTYAEAHFNLGNLLREQEQVAAAEQAYRQAITLKPDYAEAIVGLANLLKDQTQFEAAFDAYRLAVQHRPNYAKALGNSLLALQYRPGVTLAELAEAHAVYERQFASHFRASWPGPRARRRSDTRVRLGFVSPDFGQHPVGFLSLRGLEPLDRREFEIFCYSDRAKSDVVTTRFQALSTGWRDIRGWNDERVAAQIGSDQIDILYDLTGHTAQNRLLVFARKPAPTQVTWLGYEGTTGLAAIDYILADPFVIPEGAESHYRERVLRLPETYVCYDPPADAPSVVESPVSTHGSFTFGCFNNPAKINAGVIAIWARIMTQAPGSRLLLKYRGLSDRTMQERIVVEFARHGVAADRIAFAGRSAYHEYLASYGLVDLALDPFPFCGGVTTCEALWMGVPVLTLPGETFAGRHSLSYLKAIGLDEWIAPDVETYVARAVAVAQEPAPLVELRRDLRRRMAGSPLCNGPRFAEQFASIQRQIMQPAGA